eukprot:1162062-Pelagomonas_calceolata.AAC.5
MEANMSEHCCSLALVDHCRATSAPFAHWRLLITVAQHQRPLLTGASPFAHWRLLITVGQHQHCLLIGACCSLLHNISTVCSLVLKHTHANAAHFLKILLLRMIARIHTANYTVIARIHTANSTVRQLIHQLLVKIGKHHPQVRMSRALWYMMQPFSTNMTRKGCNGALMLM